MADNWLQGIKTDAPPCPPPPLPPPPLWTFPSCSNPEQNFSTNHNDSTNHSEKPAPPTSAQEPTKARKKSRRDNPRPRFCGNAKETLRRGSKAVGGNTPCTSAGPMNHSIEIEEASEAETEAAHALVLMALGKPQQADPDSPSLPAVLEAQGTSAAEGSLEQPTEGSGGKPTRKRKLTLKAQAQVAQSTWIQRR